MDIITEYEPKSNIADWAKHKKWARHVARHMRAIGSESPEGLSDTMRKRAYRMKNCADRVVYRIDEQGRMIYAGTWLCRDRLCPICAWRLSVKRLGEMIKTISVLAEREPQTKAIHIVLTVRNCELADLKTVIGQISAGFARLRRRQLWKDYIKGYMRSIEVSYNEGTHEYHPHIHIIAIVPSSYTRQIGIGDWVDMWRECCRLDYNPIVYAKHAYKKKPELEEPRFAVYDLGEKDEPAPEWDGALRSAPAAEAIIEAAKYPVKPEALPAVAAAGDLRAFAEAVSGTRIIAFGGIIKTIRAELGYTDHEGPTEMPEETIDPNDGIERYLVVYEWVAHLYRYEGRLVKAGEAHIKKAM